MLGGSIMPREVLEAMDKASEWFVDMKELNKSAGEVIANFTGAEAGLVYGWSSLRINASNCGWYRRFRSKKNRSIAKHRKG